MTRSPRALTRAKLWTAGAVAAAALTTGGVGLHLATASPASTVTASTSTAGTTSSGTSGFSPAGSVSSGSGAPQSSTSGS